MARSLCRREENLKNANSFLDELEEEKEEVERIEITSNSDPVRRISSILMLTKPEFNFQEIIGQNIPYTVLAYYLAGKWDAKRTNQILEKDEEKAFLRMIGICNLEGPSLISRLMGEDSRLESLRLFLHCWRNRPDLSGPKLEKEPVSMQYTNPQFLPSVAAQKLIEVFPSLKEQAHRINNPNDLRDLIFHAYMSPRIGDQTLGDNDKSIQTEVKETLTKFFSDYSYFFEFQNALVRDRQRREDFWYDIADYSRLNFLTKNKRKLRGLGSEVLEKAFNPDIKRYERIACLAELVDNPRDMGRLFSRRYTLGEFIELSDPSREHPDLAKMWRDVVKSYFTSQGYKFDGRYFYRDAKPEDAQGIEKFRPKTIHVFGRHIDKYLGLAPKLDPEILMFGQEVIPRGILKELADKMEIVVPVPNYKRLNYRGYKTLYSEFQLSLNEEQNTIFDSIRRRTEESYGFVEPRDDKHSEKQEELNALTKQRLKSIWR